MIRKKDITEISSKIDALSGEVMSKANRYDREHGYLQDVDIRVEKAFAFFDESTLRHAVKIEFRVNPIVLYIEDNGECTFNPRLKAMNELGLIPISDLDIVSNAIAKAKRENSGGGNA